MAARLLVFLLVAWMAASGCDDRRRRVAGACADASECETGLCYHGKCAKPCKTATDCGEQLCLDGVCQTPTEPCDDGDVCTTGDGKIGDKCVAGKPIDCGPSSQCQLRVCDAKKGCGAVAQNVDAPCSAAGDKLCAAGGLQTGGCKCGYWQGTPVGPYDVVTFEGGATVRDKRGTYQLSDGIAFGAGIVGVGTAVANATPDKQRGWAVHVGGANQTLWSQEVAAPLDPAKQELSAIVAADTGWLTVGSAGSSTFAAGWIVRLGPETKGDDGKYQAKPVWQQTVKAVSSGRLRDVAWTGSGWLAVGDTSGGLGAMGWIVSGGGDGSQIAQAQPWPATGLSSLRGVAWTGSHAIAVGESGGATGGLQGLWVQLDASGKVQAERKLLPTGYATGGLYGLAVGPAGEVAAFGWASATDGTPKGWAARLGADGSPLWSTVAGVTGKTDAVVWQTGASLDGVKWVVAGRIGPTNLPFAADVGDGKVDAFPIGAAATSLRAVTRAAGAWLLIGDATAGDGWLQRIGDKGQDACP